MAAHCDDGAVVSSNVAPATFTASVEHNPVTFAISRAVAVFEPLEVFDKETRAWGSVPPSFERMPAKAKVRISRQA